MNMSVWVLSAKPIAKRKEDKGFPAEGEGSEGIQVRPPRPHQVMGQPAQGEDDAGRGGEGRQRPAQEPGGGPVESWIRPVPRRRADAPRSFIHRAFPSILVPA